VSAFTAKAATERQNIMDENDGRRMGMGEIRVVGNIPKDGGNEQGCGGRGGRE
jgi:hypothetical protein